MRQKRAIMQMRDPFSSCMHTFSIIAAELTFIGSSVIPRPATAAAVGGVGAAAVILVGSIGAAAEELTCFVANPASW